MDRSKIMDMGSPAQTLEWAKIVIAKIRGEQRQVAHWVDGGMGISCWTINYNTGRIDDELCIKDFFKLHPLGVVIDGPEWECANSYTRYVFKDETIVILRVKEGTTATVYRTQEN